MSQENVEIVRRAIEPFNQHFKREVDLSSFARDVTVDNMAATFDGAVYHGHDGLREWLSLHRGMWKHQQTEPEEFIPVGRIRSSSRFGSSASAGTMSRLSPTRYWS